MKNETTYKTHAVTYSDIVRFYPNDDDAFSFAASHVLPDGTVPTVTHRYFRLDGKIAEPSKAVIASYEDIEAHVEKEDYKTAIGNFH
jgi:hypothetical protein